MKSSSVSIRSVLHFIATITAAYAFNVQDINNGFIMTSNKAGSLFGFSMTFHEKNGEKSLIIDAPSKRNANSSNQTKSEQTSSLFDCKLQLHPLSSVCSVLNISLNIPDDILFSCNFENCSLEQLSLDDFDWNITNKATPSRNTGPSKDHTFESSSSSDASGYYMYIEASSRGTDTPGKSAIVATPTLPATLGDCLRFWYHMFGEKIASLNIYVQTSQVGMVMIWNKNGNQGNKWIEGHVTIISERPYKGIKENWQGDIGIDDVQILKGQCLEDLAGITGSVGSTLVTNPTTMETLSCNPNWKFNCSGQMHASGACYLLDENMETNIKSIMTPFRKQVCSTTLIDIAFVIDSSQSVSATDFDDIKMWLRNVVSSLPVGPGLAQVGIMTYSGEPTVSFHLNKYRKIEDLRTAITNMRFTGGFTNTGKAIDHATKEIFRPENGMRPTAKHVAIVMTDGRSQDSVIEPSKKARAAGITLFAIGVGKANPTELRAITSNPEKYLFTIQDYRALNEIKSALQESIASLESQGKTTTTEQSLAGFSALFHNGVAIIGSPGLNDWSGGFSTYSLNTKNENQTSQRTTNTFTKLIQDARLLRNINNCDEINGGSGFEQFPSTASPHTSAPGSLQTFAFAFEEGSGESINQFQEQEVSGDSDFFLSCNATNFKTSLPENIKELEFYAYFGYSMASGKFLNENVDDLGFGAPRAGSHGMVFIVRHTSDDQGNQSINISASNTQLMDWFKGHQMGSYFGFSLCAADTNGDGIDEVIVGAPLWIGKKADEGRVFVFVSELNKEGSLTRRELSLNGSQTGDARFGYSLATPGDLNLDGYDDLIVGAPSHITDGGAVYIYYGRPDEGVSTEKYQVVRARESQTKLKYFGFSTLSSFDLDDNGYNDVALGAPGDSKVVILLSHPVIHLNVQLQANPSILNDISGNLSQENQTYFCDQNATELCVTITACFYAFGQNVTENITLSYQLMTDVNVDQNERRGDVLHSVGEINLSLNERKCLEFVMKVKIPIRKQLIPLVSILRYRLPEENVTSSLSPVLDAFDTEDKSVTVSFANFCKNDLCFADLSLDCFVIGKHVQSQIPTVVVGNDQVLTINLNLTNQMEAAYDVELEVEFPHTIYFIQSLPFSKNVGPCIKNEYLSTGSTEIKNQSFVTSSSELDPQRIKFTLINPVLIQNKSCLLLLQFGFQDTFTGGSLALDFFASSQSVENSKLDNQCKLRTNVSFQADVELHGLSLEEEVLFSKENTSNVTSAEIGPSIFHNFTINNVGPSKIPSIEMIIRWPLFTKSKHRILQLTGVNCHPESSCLCESLTSETMSESAGLNKSANGQSNVEFHEFTQSNFEIDSTTKEMFRMVSFDCSEQESRIICATLKCRVNTLIVMVPVVVQLHFRLWKETFIKGRAWKVVLHSSSRISTELSPYIVNSSGSSSYSLTKEVKTEALNGDFVITEDKGPTNSFNWWIIAVAITAGLLILCLSAFALYKFGFFKSKYKQQIEEELEWTHSYQRTYAKQNELYGDERLEEQRRLATFQQDSRT